MGINSVVHDHSIVLGKWYQLLFKKDLLKSLSKFADNESSSKFAKSTNSPLNDSSESESEDD